MYLGLRRDSKPPTTTARPSRHRILGGAGGMGGIESLVFGAHLHVDVRIREVAIQEPLLGLELREIVQTSLSSR